MTTTLDRLITDCHVATMVEGLEPYGAIRDAAVAVNAGRILWVGPRRDLPDFQPRAMDRLDGAWVTPGLIDCHTHLVFGGNRSAEFEQRLGGATYEQIAQAGGGILSTVEATRHASDDTLLASARCRLADLAVSGVTTVEIKSGYGLDRQHELRMLRTARRLDGVFGVRVRTTYLALHALPTEARGDETARAAYVDAVVEEILPAAYAGGLVDAVDAYCEPIAFSPAEVSRVFERAARLGLPVKLHADQLSNGGGAALAAHHKALSADHVEHADLDGLSAMAKAGVVAVLLPGAYLVLRETTAPDVAAMRSLGVRMAVATDCNPGTSPLASMTLAMALACTQFRLTPEEALAGATRHAAGALGLDGEVGVIAPGARADLAVWDVDHPAELSYWLGRHLLRARYSAGMVCNPG